MKICFLLFSSLFLLGIGNTFAQDTLTILHLNDTHSTLSPVGPRNEALQGSQGGIARAATVIGLSKMSEPNVLTLHAGDVFIGDLFFNVYFGAAEFQILKSLGLDAMTIGNHEWDLTPSTLLGSLKASFLPDSGFALLSANLIFPDTFVPDTLQDYITPYTIKEIGNIKVGIFGLTTPEANVISQPLPYFVDTNIVEITAAMIDTFTAQNCDVIILLSHLGLYLDQTIAGNIPGIDVIVGGHDHYILEKPIEVQNPAGDTTLIVQAGSNYLYMGKLRLVIDAGEIDVLDYQLIPLDETVPEPVAIKDEVDDLILGIEAIYGSLYSQQVGFAGGYFEEIGDSLLFPGFHDTPAGNLITDAFRSKTETDIAIEAGGSIAQPLYEGPLVAADIFRMVGYGFNEVNGLGFRIATFDIAGADLWIAIESVLATIDLNDEFFPQVSGMKFEYNPHKLPGERLKSITIGEQTINPEETYSVTGNEFLAQILIGYLGIPITNFYLYEDSTEFEVILEYAAAHQNISPLVEGRIIADTSSVVVVNNQGLFPNIYLLKQNYSNPFNPATNFEFRIPRLLRGGSDFGFVTLKIYDILGNEVATIVNEELPSGEYKYRWNAAGLASGVYFYRLKAGDFVDTKKLVLIK